MRLGKLHVVTGMPAIMKGAQVRLKTQKIKGGICWLEKRWFSSVQNRFLTLGFTKYKVRGMAVEL
jgi:hypothetical protein